MKSNRRAFLSNTSKLAVAGASGMVPGLSIAKSKYTSANDKIIVGLVGARNMGFGILNHALNQPGVECGAICDIDDDVLDRRIPEVAEKQGKKPERYKDFRKFMENKDLDVGSFNKIYIESTKWADNNWK